MVVGLVDFSKAFDSVEIPDVIESLKEQGVETIYIKVLEHIYRNAKSYIRLHKDSASFRLGKGIRQGDTSSPKLFTACLEKVFSNLQWQQKGIKIDGEFLSHLRFADDIIVFANNIKQLQQMLIELNEASLKVGLSMNIKKTKIMHNAHARDKNNSNVSIGNDIIEVVDQYIYLGQRISMDSASKEQEIKRRITLCWQAFGRASSIFKIKDIPIILKRQVYDQCILPVVTYGAETWNLTKNLVLKIRSMQRAHERIMLGNHHGATEKQPYGSVSKQKLETRSKSSPNSNGNGQVTLPGERTTAGRLESRNGRHEIICATVVARKRDGGMI